jgi:hypothetical protein
MVNCMTYFARSVKVDLDLQFKRTIFTLSWCVGQKIISFFKCTSLPHEASSSLNQSQVKRFNCL